jgi:hypothetical protein
VADGVDVGGSQLPTHHTMYPTEPMTPEQFTSQVGGLGWEHVGKIK